jgi:hypothetical protein
MGKTQKDVVIAYIKDLLQHLFGRAAENYETLGQE